jgi:hypothetical protein
MKHALFLLLLIGQIFADDKINMFSVGESYGETVSLRSMFLMLCQKYNVNKNEEIGQVAMTAYIQWANSLKKLKKIGNEEIDKKLDYELGDGMNITKKFGKNLWDNIDKSRAKEKEIKQIDELFK